MDSDKQQAYLQQIQTIRETIPEQDQSYHFEQVINAYFQDIDEDRRPIVFAFVDTFFSDTSKQFIHNATRDNALRPGRVVQSDPVAQRQLLEQWAQRDNINLEAAKNIPWA